MAIGFQHLHIQIGYPGGKAFNHPCTGRINHLIAITLQDQGRAFNIGQATLHFRHRLAQLIQSADGNVAVIDFGMF